MDFKILIFKRNINQVPCNVISLSQETRERTDAYLQSYSNNRYYIYKVYDKLLDEYSYVVYLNVDNIVQGETVEDLLSKLSDNGFTIANPYGLKLLPAALSQTDYK